MCLNSTLNASVKKKQLIEWNQISLSSMDVDWTRSVDECRQAFASPSSLFWSHTIDQRSSWIQSLGFGIQRIHLMHSSLSKDAFTCHHHYLGPTDPRSSQIDRLNFWVLAIYLRNPLASNNPSDQPSDFKSDALYPETPWIHEPKGKNNSRTWIFLMYSTLNLSIQHSALEMVNNSKRYNFLS